MAPIKYFFEVTLYSLHLYGRQNAPLYCSFTMGQSNMVEVKQVSCYATSLYAMFSTVRSLYSRSVVQFNAWMQLNVSCLTLSSTLPVFILHNSLHSNSFVLPPPYLTDSHFDPNWKNPVGTPKFAHRCTMQWFTYSWQLRVVCWVVLSLLSHGVFSYLLVDLYMMSDWCSLSLDSLREWTYDRKKEKMVISKV